MLFVILLQNAGRHFLLMTDEEPHQVQGFRSVRAGCAFFTDAYNRNHDRGYEASMSACVNFIEYAPRVIQVRSVAELRARVGGDPPRLVQLHSVSGHYVALRCRPGAKAYYARGATPALITRQPLVGASS